jgi:L-lactate dehydrogenase complex protein LldG
MNLTEDIKKSKDIQKQLIPIVYTYKQKRDLLLTEEQKESFRDDLRQIKEKAINNIHNLKEKTIKNLEKNGIKVKEATTIEDAQKIIQEIVGHEKLIIKSKSSVSKEINLKEILKDKEIIETDLGDFVVSISEESSTHPVTPAIHLSKEKIVEDIYKKFNIKITPTPEKIAEFVRNHLRSKIFNAKIGITGANVISSEGSVFILENEGNISLVSRVVDKHIIITSFDKIVETRKEALDIVKASSIFASGQEYPVYVNIISGPSKTADIEKKLVVGAQGAKEVYLILLDNSRSKILETDFKELLYCIKCGACVNMCPIYHQIFSRYGSINFPGAKGVIESYFKENPKKAFENGAFFCTTCKSCYENCPLKINLSNLIKKLRKKLVKEGYEPETSKEMIENTIKYGNPFGKIDKNKTPDKMYCC